MRQFSPFTLWNKEKYCRVICSTTDKNIVFLERYLMCMCTHTEDTACLPKLSLSVTEVDSLTTSVAATALSCCYAAYRDIKRRLIFPGGSST